MVGLFRSFAAMDGKEVGEWVLRFSGVGVDDDYAFLVRRMFVLKPYSERVDAALLRDGVQMKVGHEICT